MSEPPVCCWRRSHEVRERQNWAHALETPRAWQVRRVAVAIPGSQGTALSRPLELVARAPERTACLRRGVIGRRVGEEAPQSGARRVEGYSPAERRDGKLTFSLASFCCPRLLSGRHFAHMGMTRARSPQRRDYPRVWSSHSLVAHCSRRNS